MAGELFRDAEEEQKKLGDKSLLHVIILDEVRDRARNMFTMQCGVTDTVTHCLPYSHEVNLFGEEENRMIVF